MIKANELFLAEGRAGEKLKRAIKEEKNAVSCILEERKIKSRGKIFPRLVFWLKKLQQFPDKRDAVFGGDVFGLEVFKGVYV